MFVFMRVFLDVCQIRNGLWVELKWMIMKEHLVWREFVRFHSFRLRWSTPDL